ncbi:MAG: right-handed parallel beta-helix repeat-containing protein [Bifidobacteriaceae bacterium]|jgi:hypothetical protein|nr:right-handed parallel beta-helix repeat-containing protein [Bifidobacteriaceae bacterium]
MTVLHVAKHGSDQAAGTEQAPFATINRAAAVAVPGDTVLVHEGEYREWVKPARGGLSDARRITYQAAPGEHVVIKGSERVDTWVQEEGNVWRATLPNSLFGDWNPYAQPLEGDWVVRATEDEPRTHLGDVYLDGLSFYEVLSRAAVTDPPRRTEVTDHWTGTTVALPNPDQTVYVWYAEVGLDQTTIWANFQGANPNEQLTEVNVRRSVFYPVVTGLNYITVRGFELCQAACPWTPPTADQPGLIGPNWAKGWIIEDNVIHDAKCSAIAIGKEASTGDNYFTRRHDKPGYQYQLESVFSARHIGWSKERIGSHIIRRNRIYDCGQNGVVGHLGCVFSQIYDNHIYRIALKREFWGHEIGGIKLHAALDVLISHNLIHDCSLGTWLDWETQGTRVTRNIYFNNSRDLFVEVSHGPYLVDHNVFGSPAAVETFSDGGAYVNNLVAGTVRLETVMDRATPYHEPHSTAVKGYAVIYGGDDRWIGNLFVGTGGPATDASAAYGKSGFRGQNLSYGTSGYNGHPAGFEEYLGLVMAAMPGDVETFIHLKQPVYIHHNAYLAGAAPYDREEAAVVAAGASGGLAIRQEADGVYLDIELPAEVAGLQVPVPTTAALGRVRFVDADYEAPDGGPVALDTDLLGAVVPGSSVPGPVASLVAGPNTVKLW